MSAAKSPEPFRRSDIAGYFAVGRSALGGVRLTALERHRRGLRTFHDWVDAQAIHFVSGPLGPSCLGLSVSLDAQWGIAITSTLRDPVWRNGVGWHEMGHLCTSTFRPSGCRPDSWLSSRIERLAWCAGAIFAVSVDEIVSIGWGLSGRERLAAELEIPCEVVDLRLALAIRDREIPMLRMPGDRMVEGALAAITEQSRRLAADIEGGAID